MKRKGDETNAKGLINIFFGRSVSKEFIGVAKADGRGRVAQKESKYMVNRTDKNGAQISLNCVVIAILLCVGGQTRISSINTFCEAMMKCNSNYRSG